MPVAPAPAQSDEDAHDAAIEPSETSDPNTFDAKALAARRTLERGVDEAADLLRSTRERIVSLPTVDPSRYPDTPSGLDQRTADEAARAEALAALRHLETDLQNTIKEKQRIFADLTDTVARRHGGKLPSSWSPSLPCARCP